MEITQTLTDSYGTTVVVTLPNGQPLLVRVDCTPAIGTDRYHLTTQVRLSNRVFCSSAHIIEEDK